MRAPSRMPGPLRAAARSSASRVSTKHSLFSVPEEEVDPVVGAEADDDRDEHHGEDREVADEQRDDAQRPAQAQHEHGEHRERGHDPSEGEQQQAEREDQSEDTGDLAVPGGGPHSSQVKCATRRRLIDGSFSRGTHRRHATASSRAVRGLDASVSRSTACRATIGHPAVGVAMRLPHGERYGCPSIRPAIWVRRSRSSRVGGALGFSSDAGPKAPGRKSAVAIAARTFKSGCNRRSGLVARDGLQSISQRVERQVQQRLRFQAAGVDPIADRADERDADRRDTAPAGANPIVRTQEATMTTIRSCRSLLPWRAAHRWWSGRRWNLDVSSVRECTA